MTGKRLLLGAIAAAIGVAVMALGASACEFYFSYSEVTAPLGASGEIGVRVQKTHNNCTLPSMDEYQFVWDNVQILGSTEWEEVGPNLYERWFTVSLSQVGEGYLTISKDCTKEGYQEATLPITVVAPTDDGVWQQADEGTYPFDAPALGEVETVVGPGAYADGVLTVDAVTVALPSAWIGFDGELGETRLFFATSSDGDVVPLLVVSGRIFARFDHLVEARS